MRRIHIFIISIALLFTVNSKAQGFFQFCGGCVTCNTGLYCVNIPFLGCRCLVELVEFDAEYDIDYRHVYLTWVTATETNNNYFTVERSYDAANWDVVRYVNGNGTSSTPIKYDTYDYAVKDGVVYYRLIQTDFDGKSVNSGVIYVNIETSKPVKIIRIINVLVQEVSSDYNGLKYVFYDNNTKQLIYK